MNELTSAGLALQLCTANGVPSASTVIMILVPLPFLVGPTSAPPFCGTEGAVNKGFSQIQQPLDLPAGRKAAPELQERYCGRSIP